ncbi:MAG: hypothetical protein GY952_06275 [Rhodobacteraceae bacterium]|nr:hypothetical protein [Paracoccaceae bacterium]
MTVFGRLTGRVPEGSARNGAAIAIAALIAGCSINESGVVTSERIEADGAMLYRLKAGGIHLDTRDKQPSLTIGVYDVTHIFPLDCGGSRTTEMKPSKLFGAFDPQLSASRIAGLQLKSGPGETSVTLGLREHMNLISLDRTRDYHRILAYRPDNPAGTFLRINNDYACTIN